MPLNPNLQDPAIPKPRKPPKTNISEPLNPKTSPDTRSPQQKAELNSLRAPKEVLRCARSGLDDLPPTNLRDRGSLELRA